MCAKFPTPRFNKINFKKTYPYPSILDSSDFPLLLALDKLKLTLISGYKVVFIQPNCGKTWVEQKKKRSVKILRDEKHQKNSVEISL
jgi:hypothetical protein